MLRISTVVDILPVSISYVPLEVLRISTVVDCKGVGVPPSPLEVLRISTVVDPAYTIVCGLFLWKC